MNTNQQGNYLWHRKLNSIVTAFVFILVGIMFIGNNLGIISAYYFNLVISWQMLLIVIGLTHLIKRKFFGGLILLAVGTVFLLPEITGIDNNWIETFWPLIFIIVGLSILFKRNTHRRGERCGNTEFQRESFASDDGFVVSDNTFGSVKKIVLDPVFKGARIKNTFGETILDLRRTKLDTPQTYIDIDCTFGGIEIYLPADWNLQSQVNAVIGGCDDKRYTSCEIDREHQLVVRGTISFGGLEFKN